MFFISGKTNSGYYCVTDTKDWVQEMYTPNQIEHITQRLGVTIKGACVMNGKFCIMPYVVGASDLLSDMSPIDGIKFITTKYSAEFIIMLEIVKYITGMSLAFKDIQLLDGFDCIGFDGIPIIDGYKLSVYTNPSVTDKGEIEICGIGIDICLGDYGDDINHLDTSFKTYKKSVTDWDLVKELRKRRKEAFEKDL